MQGLPPIAAERVDECLTVDIQACALKLCKVPAAVLHALHDSQPSSAGNACAHCCSLCTAQPQPVQLQMTTLIP